MRYVNFSCFVSQRFTDSIVLNVTTLFSFVTYFVDFVYFMYHIFKIWSCHDTLLLSIVYNFNCYLAGISTSRYVNLSCFVSQRFTDFIVLNVTTLFSFVTYFVDFVYFMYQIYKIWSCHNTLLLSIVTSIVTHM